jgi:hypothetical protein
VLISGVMLKVLLIISFMLVTHQMFVSIFEKPRLSMLKRGRVQSKPGSIST